VIPIGSDLDNLFGDFENILNIHTSFLKILEADSKFWPMRTHLGQIFCQMVCHSYPPPLTLPSSLCLLPKLFFSLAFFYSLFLLSPNILPIALASSASLILMSPQSSAFKSYFRYMYNFQKIQGRLAKLQDYARYKDFLKENASLVGGQQLQDLLIVPGNFFSRI
jgi:hypothetical protein